MCVWHLQHISAQTSHISNAQQPRVAVAIIRDSPALDWQVAASSQERKSDFRLTLPPGNVGFNSDFSSVMVDLVSTCLLRDVQIAGTMLCEVCLWGCFWRTLASELINWVKMGLPMQVGSVQSEGNKKAEEAQICCLLELGCPSSLALRHRCSCFSAL